MYGIEQEIRGSPAERKQIRQSRSRPLLEAMHAWWKATLAKLSQKSDVAVAIRYALDRWNALLRYCEDGRIEMDNNAAERALRAVALGAQELFVCRIGCRWRTRCGYLRPVGIGQAERRRSGSVPEFGAAAHCRSSHPQNRGAAAVESVSSQTGDGGGMTLPPHSRNRAHNLRIAGTIRNETESLNLDWQPLESKLLAAAAYTAPRRQLYLRFQSGEVYRYFTSPPNNTRNFSKLTPRAVTSSATSETSFLTNASVGAKSISDRSRRHTPDAYKTSFPGGIPDPEDKYGAIFPPEWHHLLEPFPDTPRSLHDGGIGYGIR
jgi:hypothetical protein